MLKPAESFLQDPDLQYPVTVDPTNTLLGPLTDTWVQDAAYPSSQRGSTELKAGTYDGKEKARSYLKFNTDRFRGKRILDADLRLFSHWSSSCSTDNAGVQVRRVTSDWDPSAISWSAQPSTTTTAAPVSKAAKGYSANCPAGHVSWDVAGIVQAWADGQPDYGVRLAAVDETDPLTWRRYRSANYVDGSHDPRVRARPADTFRSKLTADQWVHLVRAEPSPSRRVLWAEHALIWGAELPEDLYNDLLAGPSRAQAAELPGIPAQHLPGLAADADPRVRAAACARWEDLGAPLRERLLADTDDAVRTAALLAHHVGVPMPREVFAALPDRRRALERCRLAPELEAELVRDGDAEVRRALAANPGLCQHDVAVLAQDPQDDIRSAVALRPDLTEEQRAAMHYDFDATSMSHTLPWVENLHGDADAMRRLAASSHPLVRRSVARARHLPPDVVARLTRDEDRAVRLFLAESCEDAPADMLLEVWRWWDGSFSHPDRPRNHPNFPRAGLLRYTDDSSGRMRRLVLDDPESTPADVAHLARDPEAEVRRRAAEDPRLSPADAVRLLNDPEAYVRDAAVRSPRLPARVLAGLLHDRDTACAAVTNPAIPVPVLHRMLTAAAAAVAARR
ncbi:DNRLRE domain-containing protein [Streptomyces sp. NPDC002611]